MSKITVDQKWKWMESGKALPVWAREVSPTLHFCNEWDGLLIEEGDPEFEACLCLGKEDAENVK